MATSGHRSRRRARDDEPFDIARPIHVLIASRPLTRPVVRIALVACTSASADSSTTSAAVCRAENTIGTKKPPKMGLQLPRSKAENPILGGFSDLCRLRKTLASA
jgi:hypothetical protein